MTSDHVYALKLKLELATGGSFLGKHENDYLQVH